MSKYIELKLYLKSEDTRRIFKEIIKEFGTGDNTIKAIIKVYKSGLLEKPKFV